MEKFSCPRGKVQIIYVSMLCPRYLQHTPLSFKLKWFPDVGFSIANLKVAELIVLFIALSMLACYKVPTLMICSSQLMV